MSGTVAPDQLLGLVEAHGQRIPKLSVGNPVLTVKLDWVQRAGLPLGVRPARPDLLLGSCGSSKLIVITSSLERLLPKGTTNLISPIRRSS